MDPVPDLAQHGARYSAAWDYLAIPGSLLWSNWQAICSPRGGRTGRLHLSLRGIRLNVTKAERTHTHTHIRSSSVRFILSYAWCTLQRDTIIAGDRNILLVKCCVREFWKNSEKKTCKSWTDSSWEPVINRRRYGNEQRRYRYTLESLLLFDEHYSIGLDSALKIQQLLYFEYISSTSKYFILRLIETSEVLAKYSQREIRNGIFLFSSNNTNIFIV